MKKRASVPIARERLKVILVSDRISCTADSLEKMEKELYNVVSKYLEITKEEFEVQVTHTHIHIRITGEEL